VKLRLGRTTCAADITPEVSNRDRQAHALSGGNTMQHFLVYGTSSPKHTVSEAFMTLAEDKWPNATLLIGLS